METNVFWGNYLHLVQYYYDVHLPLPVSRHWVMVISLIGNCINHAAHISGTWCLSYPCFYSVTWCLYYPFFTVLPDVCIIPLQCFYSVTWCPFRATNVVRTTAAAASCPWWTSSGSTSSGCTETRTIWSVRRAIISWSMELRPRVRPRRRAAIASMIRWKVRGKCIRRKELSKVIESRGRRGHFVLLKTSWKRKIVNQTKYCPRGNLCIYAFPRVQLHHGVQFLLISRTCIWDKRVIWVKPR